MEVAEVVHEPVLKRPTFREHGEANADGHRPPAFAMGTGLFADRPNRRGHRTGRNRSAVVPVIVIRVIVIVRAVVAVVSG